MSDQGTHTAGAFNDLEWPVTAVRRQIPPAPQRIVPCSAIVEPCRIGYRVVRDAGIMLLTEPTSWHLTNRRARRVAQRWVESRLRAEQRASVRIARLRGHLDDSMGLGTAPELR